jgi:hypothetical protein
MRRARPTLIAIAVLVCFPNVLGEGLKPDREVSVTSIEHRADKRYRIRAKAWVEGKTPASPPSLYYELTCGALGGYLKVSNLYKAAEAYSKGRDGKDDQSTTKILVIFGVTPEPNKFDLGCVVESVKPADGTAQARATVARGLSTGLAPIESCVKLKDLASVFVIGTWRGRR